MSSQMPNTSSSGVSKSEGDRKNNGFLNSKIPSLKNGEKEASDSDSDLEILCLECFANFSTKSNLKRHVKKFHPALIQSWTKPGSKTNASTFSERGMFICPECRNSYKKQAIISHFLDVHNIPMNFDELHFDSVKDFFVWKEQMEMDTKSKYVTNGGKQINPDKGVTSHYFKCHRSGKFRSGGRGVRNLKNLGSNKINAYCPASLKLSVKLNGEECSVLYQSVHVGHQNDLERLYLSESDKRQIASKIATKMSFDDILEDIKKSAVNDDLDRIHLLTKRDLHNIKKSYNITSSVIKHANDAVSVDMWVHEMQNSASSCILFYKPQGSNDADRPCLNDDDFVLIFMTEAQKELLEKFSSNCVCIDGTRDKNGYGFELISLIVVDELSQGFPCAFLISNRSDQSVLSIFFSCIKDEIGEIEPKVFMSDMSESPLNAWSSVMSTPQIILFCAWHIVQAWKKNLKKISGAKKQAYAYKILRSLLLETDIHTFDALKKKAIKIFRDDSDMNDFGNHFETYYLSNVSSWALCYRLNSGINTNMHLERIHISLKYIFLYGKKAKRLDEAISGLVRFVSDKMVDRLTTANEGKLVSKIRELEIRHKNSETLSLHLINTKENGWSIRSCNNNGVYKIQETIEDCSCQLQCPDCKICIHRYVCSCVDSSINWNMCLHIHYLQKYLNNIVSETTSTTSSESPCLLDDCDSVFEEMSQQGSQSEQESQSQQESQSPQESQYQQESQSLSLDQRKAQLKRRFEDIMDSLTSHKQCDIVEEMIKSIVPHLAAADIADETELNFSSLNKIITRNENTVPQGVQMPKKIRK